MRRTRIVCGVIFLCTAVAFCQGFGPGAPVTPPVPRSPNDELPLAPLAPQPSAPAPSVKPPSPPKEAGLEELLNRLEALKAEQVVLEQKVKATQALVNARLKGVVERAIKLGASD